MFRAQDDSKQPRDAANRAAKGGGPRDDSRKSSMDESAPPRHPFFTNPAHAFYCGARWSRAARAITELPVPPSHPSQNWCASLRRSSVLPKVSQTVVSWLPGLLLVRVEAAQKVPEM